MKIPSPTGMHIIPYDNMLVYSTNDSFNQHEIKLPYGFGYIGPTTLPENAKTFWIHGYKDTRSVKHMPIFGKWQNVTSWFEDDSVRVSEYYQYDKFCVIGAYSKNVNSIGVSDHYTIIVFRTEDDLMNHLLSL